MSSTCRPATDSPRTPHECGSVAGVDLTEIDAALDDHVAWLRTHDESGLLLASGRREPRVGGVIFAAGDRWDVDFAPAQDPFAVPDLARSGVPDAAELRVRRSVADHHLGLVAVAYRCSRGMGLVLPRVAGPRMTPYCPRAGSNEPDD